MLAIEVYPAATLRSLGKALPTTKNYKQPSEEGKRVREDQLRRLEPEFAGLEDAKITRGEGWIWVKMACTQA